MAERQLIRVGTGATQGKPGAVEDLLTGNGLAAVVVAECVGGSLAVPVSVQTSSSTARMGYACLASYGTESVPILGMSHWSSSRGLAKLA